MGSVPLAEREVTVVGAGIVGLWQALTLLKRGHRVTLIEAGDATFAQSASRLAGAMLAPFCEAEASEPIVTRLGLEALSLWKAVYPGITWRGSLVVAAARDQGELTRFHRMTEGHRWLDASEVGALEPELAGRFGRALFYPDEGHVAPRAAMGHLLAELRAGGADVRLGIRADVAALTNDGGIVIDCRGRAAIGEVPGLRGVRGEMALVKAPDLAVSRPIRLLHPRLSPYIVPWGDGHYMIGATVIERSDAGLVTVRSALDLLGAAFALHPGFAEAEIVELATGVRPAFVDNIPKAVIGHNGSIVVNGAYRHGFLLSPVLAARVASYIETGRIDNAVMSAA
ncbi:MAG TPA: FAD-dependent oxidoreductase [Hyphomicrobiaceae bacterium]|nr:FAD-dependent oxidoreductase [Hyphomicrobiaceae bacterium]